VNGISDNRLRPRCGCSKSMIQTHHSIRLSFEKVANAYR
jgi:hypothetical protein